MRTKRVAMLMLLMAPLALVIAILLDGLTDNVTKSDVGIVLGSKVMPDGTPSARLQARLDKADELFQQGMFGSLRWPSSHRLLTPGSAFSASQSHVCCTCSGPDLCRSWKTADARS